MDQITPIDVERTGASLRSSPGHPCPDAHVVLLGASNVTLGFPRIVSAVRQLFPGKLQILAAHGHGRSYGQRSWVPFRSLPGIRQSGLWEALARLRETSQPAPPLYALVTDIGNDLVFGNSPERIAEWIEDCVSRLQAHNASVTLGRLPLTSLQSLGRWRFRATRTLFFPKSSLTYDRVQVDAPRLDELVAGIALRMKLASFTPRPEWYGFDPIHIRRTYRAAAWREVFSQWSTPLDDLARSPGLLAAWRYWRLQPAERRAFGRDRAVSQPTWRWGDDSGIWLY
jgi:hypothetical protein